MEEQLLDNNQIVYIFERMAMDLFAGEYLIKREKKKADELKKAEDSTNDPIAKAIARIVTSEVSRHTGQYIEDFESGTSEAGKVFMMIKSIIKRLDLPYYAITGRTLDDLRKKWEKEMPEKVETVVKALYK